MTIEIERAYIVKDIDAAREKIVESGFSLTRKEGQYNTYFGHPFFPGMIESKKYLRARYIGSKLAEISFSMPEIDKITGAEIRPQHVIRPKPGRDIADAEEYLKDLGFYEALVLQKTRELQERPGKEGDAFSIHVEIDTGITIHPRFIDELPGAKHHDVRLVDTLQVCIEMDARHRVEKSSLRSDFDKIATSFGLGDKDVTEKNYFQRYFEIQENDVIERWP